MAGAIAKVEGLIVVINPGIAPPAWLALVIVTVYDSGSVTTGNV